MTFKRVLAAALMAAISALSLPASAQAAGSAKKASSATTGAKTTKKKSPPPSAKKASAKSTAKKSTAKASTVKKSPAKKSTAKASTVKASNVKKSTVKKSTAKKSTTRKASSKSTVRIKKANRVIRQDASGKVVVQRIVREPYGPWLPREAFDHPQPPCPPIDPVVLVATVHERDEDSPEATEAILEIQAAEPAASRDLTGLAQTVGKAFSSLVRPKSAGVKVKPEEVDLSALISAGLLVPVEGVDLERLRDSFLDRRGRYRKHLAIDIGAPRGTPILATTDGEIVRMSREKRGGIAIYQKDPSGRYLFFYGHLQKYAAGLSVGQKVSRGQVIGYVGRTGRVVGGPHLHFSVTRMPEEGTHREGLAVNPYLLFLMGAN